MRNFTFLFVLLFSVSLTAQNVLFTVDNDSVLLDEFERVYTKNNFNNKADYSKASINEYLDLYIKFRLKVKEAENLGMDTVPSIKAELETYRKQLAKNYLKDKKVSDDLVKEAYERSKKEIDVSHILLKWPNSSPSSKDSISVLKEANKLKNKLTAKNFSDMALKFSDDPSSKTNKGRLGYLTVFQTVYPFESAMYTTDINSISNPVATQFGYHLVLVHDSREARGQMQTAHILLKSNESDSSTEQEKAAEKIQEIYKDLKTKKYTFEYAVKQYSDDKKTKFKGGKLPPLSSAQMLSSFADAAFALENDGDISEPVKTSIGWHIIKRNSKTGIQPFDEIKSDLEQRVERDSRSQVAEEIMIADTKKDFGYKKNITSVEEVISALANSYEKSRYTLDETENFDKPVFSIGDKTLLQSDFIRYIKKYHSRNQKSENISFALGNHFDKFEIKELSEYREENLEMVNEDFKNLMQEYHDGVLLFELTDDEVWNKAVLDTAGLQQFYEQNKQNYMWGDRIQYTTYTTPNEKAASKIRKFASKGWDAEKILSKLNKKEEIVKSETFKYEKEAKNLDDDIVWNVGNMYAYPKDDIYTVTVVEKLLAPTPKLLSETRGYVISDYQNYLEKKWISRLQDKYEVNINQSVLNSLIKQ